MIKNLLIILFSLVVFYSCNAVKTTINATGRNISALFSTPRKVENKIQDPAKKDAGLAVLWIGHATCLIQIDDKFILTDPNLTTTVGQFSKRLVEPGIDPINLPQIDVVLISHMHIDHLSPGSLAMIESKIDHLLVPQQGLVYIPNFSFDMDEIKTWHSWEKDGIKITSVPAIHNGWRYGIDSGWMEHSFTGYIIEYNGKKVYFAGDTAYDTINFIQIGEKFPDIDLALVPIAPINPREFSKARHTDPIEAIQVYQDIRAKYLIPIHYDTFPESLDDPDEAVNKMKAAMKNANLTDNEVIILAIGEQKVLIENKVLMAQPINNSSFE